MKKDRSLMIVISLAVLVRLAFTFVWHELWWDSAVYIGMGKSIFSGGASGLFEHIRPPLIPFLLGALWWVNLDPIIFGRLLEIIFFAGIVWLTYQLAEHWFEKRIALIASVIITFSPIFLLLSFQQYTEIPTTFFALLSLFLFVKKKYFWAGLSTGLAFLAKFPAGMFVVILCAIAVMDKQWKPALKVATGFSLLAFPYLAWSWMVYGSPVATLFAARDAIARAMGCNVLRFQPWWQYGAWIISETKLHWLAIPGLIIAGKSWTRKQWLFAASLILPALYFIQLHCRDYRYLTLFLPFIVMLTAVGIVWFYDKFKVKKKHFMLLVILLGLFIAATTLQSYTGNKNQPHLIAEEYYHFLEGKQATGEVWSANPTIAVYTDEPINKIYYPIYDRDVSIDFYNYISISEKIEYVFLDNCGGGIICPPGEDCKTEELIEALDQKFTRVFDKSVGRCWYRIWSI